MRALVRLVLLLVVALALASAGVPPALEEDRSVPGFCSPDCPLQQDAHSVAVSPAPVRHARPADLAREQRAAASELVPPGPAPFLDPSRAPPRV